MGTIADILSAIPTAPKRSPIDDILDATPAAAKPVPGMEALGGSVPPAPKPPIPGGLSAPGPVDQPEPAPQLRATQPQKPPQILEQEPPSTPRPLSIVPRSAAPIPAAPEQTDWEVAKQWADKPLVAPQDIDEAFPFLVGPFSVQKGIMKGAAGMTSPSNAAIAAGTSGIGALAGATSGAVSAGLRGASTGLSVLFGTQAGKALLDKYPQMKQRWSAGDWQGVLDMGGQSLLDAAVVAGSTMHAAGEGAAAMRSAGDALGTRNARAADLTERPQSGQAEPAAEAPAQVKPEAVINDILADVPPLQAPANATAAEPTTPETPGTLQVQMTQLSKGDRKVVMFPKGTEAPQLPPNTPTHADAFGNVYAYDPDKINPADIDVAVASNRLPEVLGHAEAGMGAPDKSQLQGQPVAVVSRTMDGTTVQATATDEANLQPAVDAAKKITPPGGSVSVEPAENEIAAREGHPPTAPAGSPGEPPISNETGGAVAALPPEPPPPTGQEVIQNAPEVPRPEAGNDIISSDAARDGSGQPGGEGAAVRESRLPVGASAVGERTTVRSPGRPAGYPATYAVRELGDTYPSHNPFTFERNPEYHFLNDRDYTDPAAKTRVITNSGSLFDPAYLVSDNPDATNGPSIIDSDGNVLGGNNRRMTLERVYAQNPEGAAAYKAMLQKRAAYFGIDPNVVAGMKRPILVRELLERVDPQRAITDLNKPPTAALSVGEKALADARSITPETAKYIGSVLEGHGPDASLNDVLSGKMGPALVNHLIQEGIFTEAERPSLIDSESGQVTKIAKDRISKMLVGNLFEDSNEFQRLPPSMRNKLERVAPLLKQIESRPEWDLTNDVRGAISILEYERALREHAEAYRKAHGFSIDSEDAKNQVSMFGDDSGPVRPESNERQDALADLLRDTSPTGIAKAFRSYITESNSESMFNQVDSADAFQKAFPRAAQGSDNPTEPIAPSAPRRSGERGAVNANLLTLGTQPFFERDVIPKAKGLLEGGKKSIEALVHMVAPRAGVPPKTLDEVYRMKGGRDAAQYILTEQLDRWNGRVNQMSQEQMVDFIDRQKTGAAQVDQELQSLSDFLRQADDSIYAQLKRYKPSVPYLENHFRVLWKEIPRGADELDLGSSGKPGFQTAGGKRPLQGTKGMLKQHTLDTMSEGIERGGVPFSYNPIRMFEAHYADAMKYITAQRMWESYKDLGARKFVKFGERAPDGFVRLDDGIAKVYFPADAGLINKGEWYVEKGAGRVLNNFLSRDLIREQPLGRALMGVKNATTAVELSLSPFHLVFEGNEAIGSQVGIGLRKIWNLGVRGGDVGAAASGLKDIATAPTATVTAARLGSQAKQAFGNFDEFSKTPDGSKFLRDNPDAREMVRDFFLGGGKIGMHEDYKIQAYNNFREELNSGNWPGAALRGMPLLNQAIMKPLFEQYIPNLKLGFFLKEYSLARKEYADRLSSGEMSSPELARKVVDSVENRFGEMNFDNLYWNRTFKTAMQLAFRSVTWKLGNLREYTSAIAGQGAELGRAAKAGQVPILHPSMAWLMGMSLWTAVLGGTIHTLSTGKQPQQMKDYIYPVVDGSTGIRASVPTYWRDMVHAAHSPLGYAKSSLSGEIGRIADVWQNKDFYGNEVRNRDDPFWQQAVDSARHLVPAPFSVSSGRQAAAQGGSTEARIAGYAGFTKAPRYIEQTPAQLMAYDYAQEHRETGSRTRVQAAAAQSRSGILSMMRAGRDPSEQIQAAERQGLITPHDVPQLRKIARTDPLAGQIQRLSLTEALNVYDKANPEERKAIARVMRVKAAGARMKPKEWTPRAAQLAQQYFNIRPPKMPDLSAPGPIQ